jgi:hypothetical protein
MDRHRFEVEKRISPLRCSQTNVSSFGRNDGSFDDTGLGLDSGEPGKGNGGVYDYSGRMQGDGLDMRRIFF